MIPGLFLLVLFDLVFVRVGFSAAAAGFRGAPLFGECFKNVGGFVADDVFAFRHGADQAAEDGQAAKSEISAAVVDADLGVHAEERVGGVVIANANFAIGSASDQAERVFGHRTGNLACWRMYDFGQPNVPWLAESIALGNEAILDPKS